MGSGATSLQCQPRNIFTSLAPYEFVLKIGDTCRKMNGIYIGCAMSAGGSALPKAKVEVVYYYE